MRATPGQKRNHPGCQSVLRAQVLSLCSAVLLLAGTPGCGPAEAPVEAPEPARHTQPLETPNGLTMNGLSVNGLSVNGLSVNGLSVNGLATSAFSSWFSQDPTLATMVMQYLVHCAVPAGQTRAYTHATTGQRYTWTGGLGLAPSWSSGTPASLLEQQVITACMAAHANSAGRHVSLSILGRNAQQVPIPFTSGELSTYSEREACFFGNIFGQEGAFIGVDRASAGITTRACRSTATTGTPCAPLGFIGQCQARCTQDGAGPFYSVCTHNGVSYPAITTRMRAEDFQSL